VVLGDCDHDQAERRRQDMQDSINAMLFEAAPGQTLRVGVSIGASSFPDDGQTVDELMAAADRRMYADKARHKTVHPEIARTPEQLWS